MILGIGTDIIETERVRKELDSDRGLEFQIFAKREIEYCNAKHSRTQCYAARFAATEAFFKALGRGQRDGLQFVDVEITNDELGKPEIRLHGRAKTMCEEMGVKRIHLSLSHVKELANAMVVLET